MLATQLIQVQRGQVGQDTCYEREDRGRRDPQEQSAAMKTRLHILESARKQRWQTAAGVCSEAAKTKSAAKMKKAHSGKNEGLESWGPDENQCWRPTEGRPIA